MSNPHPKDDNDIWPRVRIERLRELVATGLSAAQVGVHLGCSRMAIMGKCRRVGIPLLVPGYGGRARTTKDGLPSKRHRPGQPPRPPAAKRVGAVSLPALPSVAVPVPEPPAPVVAPVLTGECCWPLGEPGTRGFRYCDAPCDHRQPYCAEHHKIGHLKRRVAEMVE